MSAFPTFLQGIIGQMQAEQAPQVKGLGQAKKANPLLEYFINAMNQANQANLSRYQLAGQTYAGQGESTKNDIFRGTESAKAGDTQDLITQGLYNTSTLQAAKRRRDEIAQRGYQSVDENVAGNLAGLIGSRVDQGPDLSMLAQLLQGFGQGKGLQEAGPSATTTTMSPSLPPGSSLRPGGMGGGLGGISAGTGGGMGAAGAGMGEAGGVGTYTNPTGVDYFGRTLKPGQKKKNYVFMGPPVPNSPLKYGVFPSGS